MALHDAGEREAALELLARMLKADPGNRTLRSALIAYLRQAGKVQQATAVLAELAAINDQDPLLQ
ncbi:hypothetical protein D3C78_1978690 [compost metagenome]